jgi:anti-anti-sigma regulatory factor
MLSLEERLKALELSVLAVWVYDHQLFKLQWANAAAVELWRAASRDELLARDLSDSSASTRTRLEGYLGAIERGDRVEEDWTLYPRGVPTTMTLYGSGVRLDDGRLAILFQAVMKAPGLDASMVRGVEAVRHSSVMVTLLDEGGKVLFHNPASLRAFGDVASIDGRFVDPGVPRAIRGAIQVESVYAAEVEVITAEGPRSHLIEARRTVDPVSGGPAVLVQQTDVTDQRTAEARAAEQLAVIEELHESFALVNEQRRQILALSAPILEVGQGTLAVPLIGRLDPERNGEVSRRLLPAIVERGALHVILDLTGADLVDAAFAASFIEIVRAVKLLGARPIVTGVRPELAELLASARVDLGGVTIVRSLRRGIELCARSAPRGSLVQRHA